MRGGAVAAIALLVLLVSVARAADPYLFFEWNVTYGTISPLGVPQRGILINGQFPGPNINSTTNNNIVVKVFNHLDEPLLFTWYGIQQRKNVWQDGMPGTNCPIPPGANFTYRFQMKDQIGSYFYFPSLGMQKAAGGFGGIRINSRDRIPVPFDPPADDYTVLIGDWYNQDFKAHTKVLDMGGSIGDPSGVLINGNDGKDGKPLFYMETGKTYRYRICNVGMKTTLNFRIQGHAMKLVEIEGSHTVQNTYDSLDIHVGQCFSVLVTADEKPMDYYMAATTRFMNRPQTATAIIRYSGSNTPPSPAIPEAPLGYDWSIKQWWTLRWNLTASAARPNPQGSYHYGLVNITRTIKLASSHGVVHGKLRYAFNGISHVDPDTPVKLAEYFGIADKVFKYNMSGDVPPAGDNITVAPNVISATFRNYIEIVIENPEKSLQSYHLDGYAFFPVGMGPGRWTPESRKSYNLVDAVSRHAIQVYPKSWTAITLSMDNAGMWNLRSNIWERQYLGRQMYVSVVSPARSVRDEYNMPKDALVCGKVVGLPRPPPYVGHEDSDD